MKEHMEQYLVISVIGHDQPGIVNELTHMSSQCGCAIADTRITVLGQEFAAVLMAYGPWSAIAKFESLMPSFAEKYQLDINHRRTQSSNKNPTAIPYMVHVVALETPNLVHTITNFFIDQNINTVELTTHRYTAQLTGAAMYSLMMTIHIPGDLKISDLRENFILFCEDHNLDAILEPEKS